MIFSFISEQPEKIKKIDKDVAKLTIKHEELKNLDMPAMTMAFKVKNLSMLDQVSVGDHVSALLQTVSMASLW